MYSARDTRLGRLVAIKVLPNAFGRDKARQQRFEEEARAASALNHPNVLTVYDVGTVSATDGSAFMVMELLEGQTLRTRLQRGEPLTRGQVIDYAIQIARGLTVAHEAGIVHRNLKPDNLFLTADGRMKILDFGVAKLVRSNDAPAAETRPAETQPGAVIGTAGYMAPEQVRGLPADTRSDIFSFGTVLFELLTWRRAFSGVSPIDTMSAILHADPLEPETPRAGRDAALFGVVRRCLPRIPTLASSTRARSSGARGCGPAARGTLLSGARDVAIRRRSPCLRWCSGSDARRRRGRRRRAKPARSAPWECCDREHFRRCITAVPGKRDDRGNQRPLARL